MRWLIVFQSDCSDVHLSLRSVGCVTHKWRLIVWNQVMYTYMYMKPTDVKLCLPVWLPVQSLTLWIGVCYDVHPLHLTTSCLCCVWRSWEVVWKSPFVSIRGVGMLSLPDLSESLACKQCAYHYCNFVMPVSLTVRLLCRDFYFLACWGCFVDFLVFEAFVEFVLALWYMLLSMYALCCYVSTLCIHVHGFNWRTVAYC